MSKEKDSRLDEYLGKGLSRATAYRRLKGVGHCKSCTCFKSVQARITKDKEEKVDNEPGGFKMADLSRIEASPKFEFCHIHKGAYKGSCGC